MTGRRYQGTFTVLENDEHGPQLCASVLDSLPPECTTWGDYEVIGTWDGERLTLTELPAPAPPATPEEVDFTSPCPEPPGGWKVVDPATTTQETMDAVSRTAGADLREVWGGALCVSKAERTESELRAIQDEIGASGEAQSTSVDVLRGVVTVSVFVDDGVQADYDERYGEGVVAVTALLQPVE